MFRYINKISIPKDFVPYNFCFSRTSINNCRLLKTLVLNTDITQMMSEL